MTQTTEDTEEDLMLLTEEQLELKMRKASMALELSVSESVLDMMHNFVHPAERYYDYETDSMWAPVGSTEKERGGKTASAFISNEADLQKMRNQCSRLANSNEFAQNALSNRVAFTVGTGLQHSVLPLKSDDGEEENEQLKKKKKEYAHAAQKVINDFIKANNWGEYEQEFVLREDRDGEWFLRRYPQPDGTLEVRVIEPAEVFTPEDRKDDEDVSMGVESKTEDEQKVIAYWVNNERVEKTEIIHRKGEVDRNAPRGISKLWSVRDNFKRAGKLQRNMSSVATVQAALVAVRKFKNTSAKQAQDFLDKRSNIRHVPNHVGTGNLGNTSFNPDVQRVDKWKEGTILNMPMGQDLDLNVKGLDASRFIAILQSELRAIAARFVMPEFMLTSDASNASYASTMVAETPAVRQFQKQQAVYILRMQKVMTWAIEAAQAVGLLPEDLFDFVCLETTAPSLVVRDEKKEAEANEIKKNNGVLSVQTWCAKEGLDYEQQQRNIQEHAELQGGFQGQPLPLPKDTGE